jgi:hypothetical protein
LIAKGFKQRYGFSYDDTLSYVFNSTSIRLLLSLDVTLLKVGLTTGKTGAAVQPIFDVRSRTTKISLPCAQIKTHGKDLDHGKDRYECTSKIRFTVTMEEAAQ